MRSRRTVAAAALGALLAVGLAWTCGPPPPAPPPPGGFAVGALGDAPYNPHETLRHRLVLADLAAHELAWVLHVGDPLWRPCSDARYRRVRARLDRLPHPVVYTPGDNEWTDCWEEGSGGYAPRERLARLREVFFARPGRSLGGRPMELVSQAGGEGGAELGDGGAGDGSSAAAGEGDLGGTVGGDAGGAVPGLPENARWWRGGVLAATVHLVGSSNGLADFPGRTAADDAEVGARTAAAVAWTRETFALARERGAAAVVVGFHANPGFEAVAEEYRQAFEPWPTVLAEEARRFGRPVLAVHGDDHDYLVDRPLAAGWGGPPAPNLTRLQVPGSPDVGWVRVVVNPGAADPFAFEERTVPRWKHW